MDRRTLAGLTIFCGALLALILTGHTSIMRSPDSAETISLWSVLLPALAAMALVRAFPPRAPGLATRQDTGATRLLLTIAVGFPLLWYAVILAGVDKTTVGALWAFSKAIFFLLVPWLILRQTARLPAVEGESLWRPAGAWRWLAPIPALLVFGYLLLLSPWAPPLPTREDYPDPVVLAIGATLTFFTANVVEELFYRVALQTRLEAMWGRWPGILVSALLFALMHLPTHGQGSLPLTLGVIVAFQGVFGLFTGYLWARYRNVWVNIAAHTIVNTVPILLMVMLSL